jgi:site-specific DNA recombinase
MRVSSDDQAREGTSLDAQLSECRRYVLAHQWPIDGEFTDVMSGTRDDRPRYQALLSRVRQLRAQKVPVVVVVAALDRFGRRMLERVRCREELKALGVTTHSVREGGEVSDLVANILASVAQEEVARLGMRIRSTWAHLSAQGWRKIGGNGVAWGYRSRVATEAERKAGSPRTVVEPDPVAAPYARELFERIAAGEPTRSVTRWAASLPDEARGGRALTRRTVQDMLVAPGYAGLITHDGPLGQWEPIVDAVTFSRVQERMEGQHRMPRQASGRYLLTGFLRCPLCGARMRGEIIPQRRCEK